MKAYEQYQVAVECRREDSSRFWTVFSVMTSVQGILFGFVTTRDVSDLAPVVAALGILLCPIWLGLQLRLSAWVRDWEKKLEEIEARNPDILPLFQNRKLSGTFFQTGFSTRRGGCSIPWIFLAAWISIFAKPLIV